MSVRLKQYELARQLELEFLDENISRRRPRPRDDASVDMELLQRMHLAGKQLPEHMSSLKRDDPALYAQAMRALQRAMGNWGVGAFHKQISGLEQRGTKGATQPGRLDPALRQRAESSLGMSLAHVRVHQHAASARAADSLGAHAFVHGSDIYLGSGVQNAANNVMAHELAHVAQQHNAAPTPMSSSHVSSPGGVAERRAHHVVPAILAGRPVRLGRVGSRKVMRHLKSGNRPEERQPGDIAPQNAGMETRSDQELAKIVSDERGQDRYKKDGHIYVPQRPGGVTLEQWLAAHDEAEKRKRGPRGNGAPDEDGEKGYMVQGEPYRVDAPTSDSRETDSSE